MHVIYCATRNLYGDLRKTSRSLLEHNDAHLHVICEDDRIEGINATCYNFSRQTFFKRTDYFLTVMCMARLAAPDLIDADRALYLDVDTIVCGDLTELYNIDMAGKWFAAVPELPGRWDPFNHERYYNAGVLLMNLRQMRADNAGAELIKAVNRFPYRFAEQDAINDMAYDKVVPLPTKYNESLCTGMTAEPVIVHYAGIRNWQSGNIIRKEYRDRYFL